MGKAVDLNVSTDGSLESFVIPDNNTLNVFNLHHWDTPPVLVLKLLYTLSIFLIRFL